ncbi:MAG TPA: tRNA (adenosine(37)-N6)-threonylcarbamoyltransferase complex ATPase subunit type 1 TsaE [Bacillota bacterium]|nr:tRNA (adenosine(37)-N6)-threonylcarbamoyltransferase complex ATPase subunit type 1 TsaE [Bacillota bacterium]HOK68027.1 tRNA (adenosine(37)-N6)-threonylcarbamoyltransferase complex ATPase subunit type 1 TsaE [Bacillota bacterium]HPP84573.1 tRNA (adenosine(37)-N6)-threonylcarbamoyltransferase complex ATPase subunit type 1 TsaE [Bacillota bacterium]
MKEYVSKCLADTERIASEIAGHLKKGSFLALYGEMGAGKTAFVRGLVKALIPECLDLVHSPTFAIVNEYAGRELTIYHFDLYRIKNEEDLYSTGFYDYPDDCIIVTEWSELFENAIPKNAVRVKIEIINDTERRITLC